MSLTRIVERSSADWGSTRAHGKKWFAWYHRFGAPEPVQSPHTGSATPNPWHR
jgi:hypothetical protein